MHFTFFLFLIATIAMCSISGCRFGNQIVYPSNPDQTSGYYVTLPQSLTFYVTTSFQTQTQEAPVSLVPTEIADVLTNPVAVSISNLSSGQASLISPTNKVSLPIYVNSDQTLSLLAATRPSTFWQDPECQSYLEIEEKGALTKTTEFTPPPDLSHTIQGKIQLHLQIVTRFVGNCGPTFQSMFLCYQDLNQCGGNSTLENQTLQGQVASLFHPYLKSGAIAAEDIPQIKNYAYEVFYE
jgi:hypothetical protein